VLQPLMEHFRLRISRSPNLSVFLVDLVSDGDSVYSTANFPRNYACRACHAVVCCSDGREDNLALFEWKCLHFYSVAPCSHDSFVCHALFS